MGEVNRARANKVVSRHQHNADDSQCRYWQGDFAGVNLWAQCDPCRQGLDLEPPKDYSRLWRKVTWAVVALNLLAVSTLLWWVVSRG